MVRALRRERCRRPPTGLIFPGSGQSRRACQSKCLARAIDAGDQYHEGLARTDRAVAPARKAIQAASAATHRGSALRPAAFALRARARSLIESVVAPRRRRRTQYRFEVLRRGCSSTLGPLPKTTARWSPSRERWPPAPAQPGAPAAVAAVFYRFVLSRLRKLNIHLALSQQHSKSDSRILFCLSWLIHKHAR